MVKLSNFEKQTLEVLQFAIGIENAITTQEMARKIFIGKDILCHSPNRQHKREICVDYESMIRAAIHNIRIKIQLYVFSISLEAEAVDIEPDSLTYKQKIVLKKRAYFIPIGKDLTETLKLIENARRRLEKNIRGNERTLKLLQKLKNQAETSNLTDIIFEQQEKIKKALLVSTEV